MSHPMQPVVLDDRGVARFKANAIIRYLADVGALDLNEIARMDFDDEDRAQVAQLLGYSVSGFGDLHYASDGVIATADAEVERLLQQGNADGA